MTSGRPDRDRFPWWLGLLGGVFLVAVAWMVVVSLRDRTPPTYPPAGAGDTAVADSGGALRVTLDARDPERWTSVDLATGRVHDGRVPGWDLAARRFHVIANGGPGLPGDAAVAHGDRPVPEGGAASSRVGWTVTERDEDGELSHPLLEEWYEYDFFSHLLTPRKRTYLVRTTDGRLAEVRFLSYYCPGPEAGCVTLRWALRDQVGPGYGAAGSDRPGAGEDP